MSILDPTKCTEILKSSIPLRKEFRRTSVRHGIIKVHKTSFDNLNFQGKIVYSENPDILLTAPFQETSNKYLKSLEHDNNTVNFYISEKKNFSLIAFKDSNNKTIQMDIDSIRIPGTNKTLNHTIRQTTEAFLNKDHAFFIKNREVKREELFSKIVPEKRVNLLVAKEGLGKTSSIKRYKEIYNAHQVIITFNDNKLARQKYNECTEKSAIFIPGKEEFLRINKIPKEYYIKTYNELEDITYIDVIKTINDCPILKEKRKIILLSKYNHFQDVIKGKIHYDFIYLTKDKLDKELYRGRFKGTKILYILDEYRKNDWLSNEVTDNEKYGEKFEGIEFGKAIYLKDIIEWTKRIPGKIIILTTEDLPIIHLIKKIKIKDLNIVDVREVTPTRNVNLICTPDSLMSTKLNNKRNTVSVLIDVGGYNVYSDGTKSKTNTWTFKGREIKSNKSDKWLLALSKPHPKEVAGLMKELELTYDEVAIILLSDLINQFIGRWEAYRHKNYESIDILIPKCYFNEVLPRLKYHCNVERNLTPKYSTKRKKESMKRNKAIEILYALSILTGQIKHKDNSFCTTDVENYLNKINGTADRIKKLEAIKIQQFEQYKEIQKYGLTKCLERIQNRASKIEVQSSSFFSFFIDVLNTNWFPVNESIKNTKNGVRILDG